MIMKRFPDNFKCAIWKNYAYFTHFYDGSVRGKELELTYLFTNNCYIDNNKAYGTYRTFKEFPDSDIKEIIKYHYRNRDLELDFTKENFIELPFNELPIKVQNLFRQFEEQEGFKISEGVSFNIDNMF